jgi:hypothetical protein
MIEIPKYSLGIGDRFAHQGIAQLSAFVEAAKQGIELTPVWNKSNREHTIIHTEPSSTREEADAAVAALGWKSRYFVDADHIGLATVDRFLSAADFFTIDVADFTGKQAPVDRIGRFLDRYVGLNGELGIPGLREPLSITPDLLLRTAHKFLPAMEEAGRIYRHIAERKGAGHFVTEVSVDETDTAQTPAELLLILAMIAAEGIPVQTIAPKFTGRFNKGVDYAGDLAQFEKEFEEDLHVIAFAVREFGLPSTLKLSVHSGSDKFSIYPAIRRLVAKHDAGLHVKTAGTTWLEEVIGLAESGGKGLQIAREIYAGACSHFDELTAPYATVIDIRREELPAPAEVNGWSSGKFVDTLRHIPGCPEYNANFRQLVHVGFKVAARMGTRYTDALKANREIVAKNVTGNLLHRHILPLFGKTPDAAPRSHAADERRPVAAAS